MSWNSQIIGAAAAIVLSTVFAAIGAIARINRHKTQVLATAHFQLLQLWRELRIMAEVTLTDYARIYVDEVRKRVPGGVFAGEEGQTLEHVLLTLLRTFVPSSLVGGHSVEAFDATLLQIAAFHPFLAHRLATNGRLRAAIVAAENYGKQVAALSERELAAPDMNVLNSMLDDMLRWVAKDSLHLLERDLLSLSWKVGLGTFLATVFRLKVRRQDTAALLKADVKRFVDHMFRAGGATDRANTTEQEQTAEAAEAL